MTSKMMTESSIPEFPNDIPTASIDRISLHDIQANSEVERKRLYNACTTIGLFLLDLTDTKEGHVLLSNVKQAFQLAKQIFDLELEEKKGYSMLNGTVLGYKGAGVGRIDSKGTPDRCEFWCMGKDDVLGITIPPLPAPTIVNENRELFAGLARCCHDLSMIILDQLEIELLLPPKTFRVRHRINEPSSDQTRLIRYLPQPETDRRTSLVPHTDYGSITVLFNDLGGLQILPEGKGSDDENWVWIRPEPGCAIINMGDAMVKFTNGLCKSPMHRVTYAPGKQGKLTRYSLAQFIRPEDSCLMRNLWAPPTVRGDNEDITAKEWILTRVKAAQVQERKEKTLFPDWATKGLK